MSKVVFIDGVPHRTRRGKLVPIPLKWYGKITTKKTINGRNTVSRRTRKSKKKIKRD